ncbi:MAG: ABC transporter permease [Actinomycetota bacterium]|nr:ABC transporter permease [Actinomycetota bacterium]
MAYAATAPARHRVLRPVDVRRAAGRAGLFLAALAVLWGLWEAIKAAGGLDERTLPHVHQVVGQLFEPSRRNGPLLLDVLVDAALVTAKEAAAGFALGAVVGFALGVVLAHSRLLQRGVLPYIVASQTVPILVIAPVVVVGLSAQLPEGLRGWGAVAVIAAYLTFFPVAINTLRGLTSVDPRGLELMRSYAASRRAALWKLRLPTALPFLFAALKVSAPASVVGAIIGELPGGIADGLGNAILNFNQYYVTSPSSLWATNLVAAALGISFFLAILAAERVAVRRAPEHVA